jgi:hypothetical protein
VDWKICRGLHIEFYLGVTICKVGFKQEVVGCGERGFEFVKEAVMPYSIESLLNVRKGSRVQFLIFQVFSISLTILWHCCVVE